ncbi:MAG: methyltransferase domain-containing protein [Bacteroidia bacterium]|nr:methyltransferase domain-containing protein [Bacteroidia bacterium]
MQFSLRSNEKEYLDNYEIETKDLFRNLRELNVINKYLGGYNASRKGLATILNSTKSVRTILDIGFGGGDSIKQLSEFSEKRNIKLFFYGVDLKKDCVKYAENNLATFKNKELICNDYRTISAELLKETDVIHCSLFLHHLTSEEIIDLFRFGKSNHCIILANDLHRNWFAYYSIKFLTAIFSRSYLVKNDAPLSVKRGFRKKELVSLLERAGFKNFSVKWSWAFRYILIAVE